MLHSLVRRTYFLMDTLTPITIFLTHSPVLILSTALAIVTLYAMYLDHKIHRFTRGQSGASLEEIMKACVDSVSKIEERNEFISKHALTLDERVSHALRNAQTIRYKAFDANGSNQSFSIALLNEKGNGVIISSLHSRDRMSTFAKPVQNYESTYELTEEETLTVTDAKKAHKLSKL